MLTSKKQQQETNLLTRKYTRDLRLLERRVLTELGLSVTSSNRKLLGLESRADALSSAIHEVWNIEAEFNTPANTNPSFESSRPGVLLQPIVRGKGPSARLQARPLAKAENFSYAAVMSRFSAANHLNTMGLIDFLNQQQPFRENVAARLSLALHNRNETRERIIKNCFIDPQARLFPLPLPAEYWDCWANADRSFISTIELEQLPAEYWECWAYADVRLLSSTIGIKQFASSVSGRALFSVLKLEMQAARNLDFLAQRFDPEVTSRGFCRLDGSLWRHHRGFRWTPPRQRRTGVR